MSFIHQAKINDVNYDVIGSCYYGTSSTAAGTAAKVATVSNADGFVLVPGVQVAIKFTTANTASSPTLNVNSTGAKTIKYRGSAITSSAYYWGADQVVTFVYDGEAWQTTDYLKNPNSDTKATTTLTTTSGNYPVILKNTTTVTDSPTTTLRYSSKILANPSTGGITVETLTTDDLIANNISAEKIDTNEIYTDTLGATDSIIISNDTGETNIDSHAFTICNAKGTRVDILPEGISFGDESSFGAYFIYNESTKELTWGDYDRKEIKHPNKAGTIALTSDIPTLATVATTGSYNDLTNKPTIPSAYTHPSHTAKASGLYKITVDSLGHVSAATAVAKSDITGLGVPAQDTTYSAGTGISLSGTTFSNSGVRSISTGSTNGTISVNTNGSSAEVAVKGLGSNAYTSTAYLPKAGGSLDGSLTVTGSVSTTSGFSSPAGINVNSGSVVTGNGGQIKLTGSNAYLGMGITSTGIQCYFQTYNPINNGAEDDYLKAGFGFGWSNSLVIDQAGNVEIPGKINGYTIAQLATDTDTKVKQTAYSTSANLPILTCTAASPTSGNAYETYYNTDVYINHNTKALTATKVYGAVWNDYAEYRAQEKEIEPGYCVASKDDGKVYKTTKKFQACDGIVSDTFGFGIGETDDCKTPLAVAGRVLAYAENPEELHSGDTVCAGPNGKVVKMTREEIREWPDRVLGIVSEIPTYETWGTGNVKVNGRIWIKVK